MLDTLTKDAAPRAGDAAPQQAPAAAVSADSPLVTIGLPVYNGARSLSDALDSLLATQYPNVELVISDNASTDATPDICRAYAARDPRIRVVTQPVNRGALANFRAVLKEARGSYFMWASDDDQWHPDFIGTLVAELEAHPAASIAMCATERLDGINGPIINQVRLPNLNIENGGTPLNLFRLMMSPAKVVFLMYGLYRRDILQKAMRYFPDTLGGDRQFLCQFAFHSQIRYVDQPLYRRAVRPEHEAKYRSLAAKPEVLSDQLLSMTKLILKSDLIPIKYKFLYPYLIGLYMQFTVGKAFRNRLRQQKLDPVTIAGTLKRLAVVGLVIPLVVWLILMSGEPLRTFLAAELIGLVLGLGYLSLLFRFRKIEAELLRLKTDSKIRSKVAATVQDKFGRAVFKHLGRIARNVGKVQDYVIKVNQNTIAVSKQVMDIGSEVQRVSGEVQLVGREVRRVTDLELLKTLGDSEQVEAAASLYARNRLVEMRRAVSFARMVESSRIRELYLQEIFDDIDHTVVPIGAMNELSGHPNKTDMLIVCAIAKHLKARRVFEFGTYLGRTTYHLTFSADDTVVTTLNLPPDAANEYSSFIGRYYRGTDREPRIEQIFQDSREFDPEPLAGQFDVVFVDADHSYDMVKIDTLNAYKLVKPGGIILWHDYAPKSDGLLRFFAEFTQKRPLFRIKNTCLLLHIDGVDPMGFTPKEMPPSLELEHMRTEPFQLAAIYHQ